MEIFMIKELTNRNDLRDSMKISYKNKRNTSFDKTDVYFKLFKTQK